MIRGIESLDVSREASNFDKLDAIFEKRPHGAGSFKCIESGIVYFILWTFSDDVYSFRFITQNGEKISTGLPTDTFGSLIASLKDFPIGTVSPSKTIQEVLDENGRSAIIQGTLGTYLVILFPNDPTHTTLRFYQTIYGTSSKITGAVLNSESLITAYNSSIAESYDTSFEDITPLFNDYVVGLTALGLTNILFTQQMIIKRTGTNRTITGTLKFDNPTEASISIPQSLKLCSLESNDYNQTNGWAPTDNYYFEGSIMSDIIDALGELRSIQELPILPGVNHYISLNLDYSI